MSEKSTTSKKTEGTESASMSATAELQKMGFGSLAWLGAGWVENMNNLNTEVLQFISDRVKEDIRTQQEILHAKDLTEVQEIQTRFMRDAFDQYAAETGKLIEMSNDFLAQLSTKPDA